MRSKVAFAAFGLVALLVLASPGARAQSNVYVAAKPPSDVAYTALGYQNVFPTVTEAVARAIASAATAYQHYDVLVDWNLAAPWVESLDIYADADITIRGIHSPFGESIPDPPQDIILESPSTAFPVINMVPPLDSTGRVDRFIVDGLTLTGGSVGFHAKSGAYPTLNRVYIRNNAGSGVLCEGGSNVQLINCSIVRNGHDGVEVGADSFAQVVFCTILQNPRSGVHVDSSAFGNALVASSIIYENVQSGLEWTSAAAPILSANDVYGNGAAGPTADPYNYVNVPEGPNSLREDPILWPEGGVEPTPWLGALMASRCIYGIYGIYDVYNDSTSPVIDMADDSIVILPFTAEDFYRESRPYAFLDSAVALPDMGADEVVRCGFGLDLPVWWSCIITPEPLEAGAPVGKVPAGSLKLEIGLTHAGSTPPEAFMVPQDGNTSDPATWITFTMTSSTATGTYYFESTRDVDSTTLGYIVDGHAIVYLSIGSFVFGVTDSQLIQGQAITGRHTIIDTTPPRFAVPLAGFSADELVVVRNAQPELTATVGATTAGHPALPGFPALWLPATDPAPVLLPGLGTDDGLITPAIILPGLGAQIFTNAGSISNGINGDNLDIEVTLPFEDPPPTDANGNELTGRVVSGFPVSSVDPEITTGPSNVISEWRFDVGTSMFGMAEAQCMYTTSGDNFGFDPDSPGGPGDVSFNYSNRQTSGVWTFSENGLPGLGWSHASDVHAAIRFRAIDRAGNKTEIAQLVEPLQIWWLSEVHSRIVPNQEGLTIAQANFSVQIDRSYNPPVTAALQPLFTYRFYTSPDYGGPYTVFSPWAPWQYWTSSSTIVQAGNFGGQWVLLVTLAADEAGNVEQWPNTIDFVDDPQGFNAGGGVNWMRFRIDESSLDTTISPNFWHDNFGTGAGLINSPPEAVFGARAIIPSPPDLTAAYVASQVRIGMQAAGSTTGLKALWFLYAGGTAAPVLSDVVPLSNPVFPIPSAVPINPSDLRLEDTADPLQARRAKNWVLSAQAFIDTNNDDAWEDGESIDLTPASFAFTVVPETSLDAYVRNRESIDRQPIKVQEER